MLHELWDDPTPPDEGSYLTFCLAGPMGDKARSTLSVAAQITWTLEAGSHFEAMTLYYEHQGWGTYTTDFPLVDQQTYREWGYQ